MAKTSEELAKIIEKAMKNIAEESKRTNGHWHEIGKVIETGARHFDKGFLKASSTMTGVYPVIQGIGKALSSALTGSDRHLENIRQKYRDLRSVRDKTTDWSEWRKLDDVWTVDSCSHRRPGSCSLPIYSLQTEGSVKSKKR